MNKSFKKGDAVKVREGFDSRRSGMIGTVTRLEGYGLAEIVVVVTDDGESKHFPYELELVIDVHEGLRKWLSSEVPQ